MFSSKQQVACFYYDWNGRKDKAKDHCTRNHPGKTFKLKFAENNMEKFFQKNLKKQKRLQTLSVTTSRKKNNNLLSSFHPHPLFDALSL